MREKKVLGLSLGGAFCGSARSALRSSGCEASRAVRLNGAFALLVGMVMVATGCLGIGSASGPGSLRDLRWADDNPAWSPDGRWIVFSSTRAEPLALQEAIYVARPDGTGLKRLTMVGLDGGQPSFSPDGKQIVYASGLVGGTGEITVMRADGSGTTFIAACGDFCSPRWSPDGRLIAFVRNGSLWVVAPNGTGLRRLVFGNECVYGGSFAWSPDSKQIAYGPAYRGCPNGEVYTVQIASGKPVRLTHNAASLRQNPGDWPGFVINSDGNSGVAWSPDGSKIAFVRGQESATADHVFEHGRAFVVDVNGHNEHLIASTSDRRDDNGVTWLPGTSDTLLIESTTGVYRVSGNGKDQRRIVAANWGVFPIPSPQGTQLLLWNAGPSDRPQTAVIFLMSINGSTIRRFTQERR